MKINLYPEVLLLLKRGYLKVEDNFITVEDNGTKYNLFHFDKKDRYLQVLDSDKGTYSTYYPRSYNRHKLLAQAEKANLNESKALIFISNQYPGMKNGHTNLTMVTDEGDHYETSELHLSKKKPSPFKYVETLFVPTEAVIAGQVYGGNEGDTGLSEAIGFAYNNKTVVTHLKADAFIDSLTQKTPEMAYSYHAFSNALYRGFNCTKYAMHALAEIGIMMDKLVGSNHFTYSPGLLGRRIKEFAEDHKKQLDFEVFIKNPDGSAVNNESIKFYKIKRYGKEVLFVDGGDSKDKVIRMNAEKIINPNLSYVLWKIHNNEAKREGNTYTITADPILDMQHSLPARSAQPIKPPFFLELGRFKIRSENVLAKSSDEITLV